MVKPGINERKVTTVMMKIAHSFTIQTFQYSIQS